jgi:phosphatidylglycerophosphate synthase
MARIELTVPNGVTLARLALVVALGVFVWQNNFFLVVSSFALAWALDVVDGWLARSLHQETATGSLLDKFTDRLLVIGGVILLIGKHFLPPWSLVLLVKDAVVIPATFRQLNRHQSIADMERFGKVVTALQGLAVVWLLLSWPGGYLVVGLVAILGAIAGWRYNEQMR